MTMRKVFVLAIFGLLLARPCAASDPTPLIVMVIGVPALFLSLLALTLAASAPRVGFFAALVLLIFLGASIGSLGGMLVYLSLGINVIALLVSVAKLSREPEKPVAEGKTARSGPPKPPNG